MPTIKHGLWKSPEYKAWSNMIQRCCNPKHRQYADYGGRGVKVCAGWRDFTNFWRDMGPRPTHHHSIDRKDNDGIYEPENCRWATQSQQNANTRNSLMVTFNGVTKSLSDWCAEFGLPYNRTRQRITILGWTPEKALTEPRKRNQFK